MFTRLLCSAALVAFALMVSSFGAARAAGDDGIVKFKSAYDMPETIKRLKKDVADKGIMFFDEIDQAKLAADAGVQLLPSTLLVFGNPPLGTLFLTSDPDAGLAGQNAGLSGRPRQCVGSVYGFRLDRAPPRHHQPGQGIQHGHRGDFLHHLHGQARVAPKAMRLRRAGSKFR
jgi:hypothetical protein